MRRAFPTLAVLVGCVTSPCVGSAAAQDGFVPRFAIEASGLELRADARRGRFLDVVGRRSALFGYEGRPLEAWVYPLKLVDDLAFAFRLKDYPVEIEGEDVLARVEVRPEATVLVYSHAAFTVRAILFAPIEEPGLAVLLDVESALPMTVIGRFRPRLRLMWPAGLMTPNLEWDEKRRAYVLSEESRRFVGILGSPGARDLSVMPYQEEPKDVPIRFEIEAPVAAMRTGLIPVVLAGSVNGRDEASAAYARILGSLPALYAANVAHYRRLQDETLSVVTPDALLDRSFAWAKVGIDKGLATNPLLGTGLLAGFRTSGDSERPGFGWFFGRDALWTALAIHSYGDFAAARQSLEFLRRVQRTDGKIPHEISQSATLLPWFSDYPYPWNSADATPLFVVAQADHWRATGDRRFLDDELGRHAQGLALHGRDGHGRQRPRREHALRTRLGGGRRSLPRARGDLPAGRLDRSLPRSRRARGGARRAWPGRGGAPRGRADPRGGRADVLARGARVLRLRDGSGARQRGGGARSRAGAAAGEARGAREGRPRRRGHRDAGGAAGLRPAGRRAGPVPARPPGSRCPRRGLGSATARRHEPALRSALVPSRLGVAALHRVGLARRLPLRAASRGVPAPARERGPALAERPRLRHRACSPAIFSPPSAAPRTTRSGPRPWS